MAVVAFTPGASQQVVAQGAAQTFPIAGTTLRISNLGPNLAFFALGSSTPVAVTPTTGMVLEPSDNEFIVVGANTFIGVCTDSPVLPARLNITAGT